MNNQQAKRLGIDLETIKREAQIELLQSLLDELKEFNRPITANDLERRRAFLRGE